ncbi:hypothetical protein KY342_03135, partial [Candidatus Woesearchaeota archaeon]|nr:hypothetical protein [Candidatus Woesearchaeota archaeon]
EDITKKEELRKELGPFVPKENLEKMIEKGHEKEAIVMRKLKEPRHDQDLAYLVGKIHDTGIDQAERERYNKKLQRVSSMALESIMTISTVANHYYNTDFQKAGIKLFDPLENNPGYYANEISKNITRIIISNLIEQGLMRDKEDEINSYKLPPEFEQRVKHVFAPVLEHLANPQFRGCVQGETRPFHLAMHEFSREGKIWQGYYLFDFDKSRKDNVVLDIVRYLNNHISSLNIKLRRNLFLGTLIHGAKMLSDIREKDPSSFNNNTKDLPIKFPLSRKRAQELQQKYSIVNIANNPHHPAEFRKYIKRTSINSWLEAKDYVSLFSYIELAGRASKTEYGKERDKYADIHDRIIPFYRNAFVIEDNSKQRVELGKFYRPDKTRAHCAKEIHNLLDRMISNKRQYLGYHLSDPEVNKLKELKRFFEEFIVKYQDKEAPIKYFSKPAQK